MEEGRKEGRKGGRKEGRKEGDGKDGLRDDGRADVHTESESVGTMIADTKQKCVSDHSGVSFVFLACLR